MCHDNNYKYVRSNTIHQWPYLINFSSPSPSLFGAASWWLHSFEKEWPGKEDWLLWLSLVTWRGALASKGLEGSTVGGQSKESPAECCSCCCVRNWEIRDRWWACLKKFCPGSVVTPPEESHQSWRRWRIGMVTIVTTTPAIQKTSTDTVHIIS